MAECDDVALRVPFYHTPWQERTPEQKIQTRRFQIECRQDLIKKMRTTANPPSDRGREPCDNFKCDKIFKFCNNADAHREKFPICDDGQCRVDTDGSGDYCSDVYKRYFGGARTYCYDFVLTESQKATVGKCWRVKREKIAEANEEYIDKYTAEIHELELKSGHAQRAVGSDDDRSAGKVQPHVPLEMMVAPGRAELSRENAR